MKELVVFAEVHALLSDIYAPVPTRRSCRQRGAHRKHVFRRLLAETLEPRCLLSAQVGSSLAYLGIASPSASPTNPGLVFAADLAGDLVAPLHAPFSSVAEKAQGWSLAADTGFSGLVFGPGGNSLLAATSSTSHASSNLVTINPYTGAQTAPPAPILWETQPLHITDLAVLPSALFQLYGIGVPAAAPAAPPRLYIIDPGSGQAAAVPDPPAWLGSLSIAEGLALGVDGTMYVSGREASTGANVFYVQQSTGGTTQVSRHLLGPNRVVGMDTRLTRDVAQAIHVDVLTALADGQLKWFDPGNGQFLNTVNLAAPLRGVAGDIVFPPEPSSLTLQEVHRAHFETGTDDYSADNDLHAMPGMWHRSSGRHDDKLINHTHGRLQKPGFSWYYGQFETSRGGGTYLTNYRHGGTLTSPWIELPDCATTTLSFSYLLGVREQLDVDFVEVWAQYVDGAGQTQRLRLLSRAEGTLPQTGNRWLTATADLTPFAGHEVQIQFVFDTGNVPDVDPEGWYVDDIVVASMPKAVCGHKFVDADANRQWDHDEPGWNGVRVYADLNGNGRYDVAFPERPLNGTLDANTFASGRRVIHAPGQVILEVSATAEPIWAMLAPSQPSQKVFARGTAAGDELWSVGPMLRARFPTAVHTVSLDVARAETIGQARVVLEAFDEHHNRLTERVLPLTDAQWQTLTVSMTDSRMAYVKASVDQGTAWFNNLRFWGTAPAVEGDPAFVTRNDGRHDGPFWFDSLPPGEYTIREMLPEGWVQSYPGSSHFAHVVTVTAGQSVIGPWETTEAPNFGNFQPAIFGYKWHDEDYDGFWDGHESEGLNGWTIELYQDTNGNGALDAGEPLVDWTTTQTNGERDGVFWFADVLPGNYILREVIPERWEQTFPANSNLEHAVTVVAGQQVLGRWQETQSPNFGNARPPLLEIQKFVSDDGESWFDANSPTGPDVYQGHEPQFKFVVTNVGLVDLENLALSDASVSEFEPPPPGSLRVGESFTTYAAGVWQIGQQENVATVSAGRGTRTAQASDRAFYFGAAPHISLLKQGQFQDENGDGNADAGETIVYTFTVTNSGNVSLGNVALTDSLLGDLLDVDALAPGEVWTSTASYSVTQADIDQGLVGNEAVATANAPNGTLVQADARHSENLPWDLQINVVKTGEFQDENADGDADAGETIRYTFTVTNSANVTLTNVALTDSLLGEVGSIGVLAPGENWTSTADYTITQADVDQGLVGNQAVVTGNAPNGTRVDADARHTEHLPWDLQINVVKTGEFQDENADGDADAGETIRYTFSVTNSANVTLTNVALTDSLLGEVGSIGVLAPGENWTSTADYTITQADVDQGLVGNEAVVTANAPNGTPVQADAQHTEHLPWNLQINVVKTGEFQDEDADGCADPGETIRYEFTVTSSTNVTLRNVALTDSLLGEIGHIGELAPGEVWTYTTSYTITQGDIDQGLVENEATIAAAAPNGDPVAADARHIESLPWCLGIRLDKDGQFDQGGNGAVVPGKQITYTFTVENTGNVTLANVTLHDPLLASVTFVNGDANANGLLDVGEVWRYTASYVVTPADISAGAVENLATVTATAPDGQQVRDEDTHREPLIRPLPEVQVVQFVTPLSVYREDGLFEPQPVVPTKAQWIEGSLWHDVNQDGIWNEGEQGRKGWRVFLDLNDNGVWDGFPEDIREPLAITDEDGRFLFSEDPGTYHLRVDVANMDLSDGAFLTMRFPGSDGHRIVLETGQPVIGASGPTLEPTVPNIGLFVYSPFIRPADNHVGRILHSDVAASLRNDLLTALEPWQAFTVVNTTGAEFEITEIQKSIKTSYIPVADQFVTVFRKQSNGELQRMQTGIPLSPTIRIQPNESVQFWAFYDPAIRQGDTVIEQYPDWYGENLQTHPAHTFDRNDHLSVITDTGTTFRIDLVGGSTYDSDILVDGAVDRGDLRRLNDQLLSVEWPIPEGGSPLFDPLSDSNARCPNGAAGVRGTCTWPLVGDPRREIGLGDFATLNVEWDRARAPFLDLDADNSSGARGTGYVTIFTGCTAPIADTDARFANSRERELSSLSVLIANWIAGDRLEADLTELPGTITVEGNGTGQLRLHGPATVEDYAAALRWITFTNNTSNLMDRTVRIDIQAKGNSHPVNERPFTKLASDSEDDWELVGNIATATIIIKSTYLTSWQNPANPLDVNGDSAVTPLDVASLVSYLNVHPEEARLPIRPAGCYPFYDVNRDGYCTALDALLVIRDMAPQTIARGEGEAAEGPAQTPRSANRQHEDNPGPLPFGISQQNAEVGVAAQLPDAWGAASHEIGPFNSLDASRDVARAVVPPDSRPCGRAALDTREDPADPNAEQSEGEVWLADLVADILAVRF